MRTLRILQTGAVGLTAIAALTVAGCSKPSTTVTASPADKAALRDWYNGGGGTYVDQVSASLEAISLNVNPTSCQALHDATGNAMTSAQTLPDSDLKTHLQSGFQHDQDGAMKCLEGIATGDDSFTSDAAKDFTAGSADIKAVTEALKS